MPIYYDSMDLSTAEKQRFAIGALALGMTQVCFFTTALWREFFSPFAAGYICRDISEA